MDLIPELYTALISKLDTIDTIIIRLINENWKELVADKVGDKCKYFTTKPAQKEYLDLVKWGRENGYGWNRWTCAYFAKGDHLEALKWARENGCDLIHLHILMLLKMVS